MRFRCFLGYRGLRALRQGAISALALVAFAQTPPATQNQLPPHGTEPAAPLVIIDPAHGGSDSGAALNAAMPEKDVTLVFGRRLRQELASRGIAVRLLRDGDATLTADQRAEAVNGLRPALYVVIHVTSLGGGVRLYTALLPAGSANHGPFLDWQTAQASALDRSHALQDEIARALRKNSASVRILSAPLRPLNNVTVPALAIEIAPTNADVSQLASPAYQQTISSSLANGIFATIPLLRARLGSPK